MVKNIMLLSFFFGSIKKRISQYSCAEIQRAGSVSYEGLQEKDCEFIWELDYLMNSPPYLSVQMFGTKMFFCGTWNKEGTSPTLQREHSMMDNGKEETLKLESSWLQLLVLSLTI